MILDGLLFLDVNIYKFKKKVMLKSLLKYEFGLYMIKYFGKFFNNVVCFLIECYYLR